MAPHVKVETPIPVIKFGKDHWSTFAYLECRAVDHEGIINREHMRCNIDLHPGLANRACEISTKEYPTRLKGGVEVYSHDDWSCFEDLEAAGLVEWKGTGIHPIVEFTDKGKIIAGRLRAFKQAGGKFMDFDPGTI